MGYSPALGFIHTGKQLSFVYDIADLYKTEITIPLAFDIVREDSKNISTRIRKELREKFRESRLLKRIAEDIKSVLDIKQYLDDQQRDFLENTNLTIKDYDTDDALPGFIWDPEEGFKDGGQNFNDEIELKKGD